MSSRSFRPALLILGIAALVFAAPAWAQQGSAGPGTADDRIYVGVRIEESLFTDGDHPGFGYGIDGSYWISDRLGAQVTARRHRSVATSFADATRGSWRDRTDWGVDAQVAWRPFEVRILNVLTGPVLRVGPTVRTRSGERYAGLAERDAQTSDPTAGDRILESPSGGEFVLSTQDVDGTFVGIAIDVGYGVRHKRVAIRAIASARLFETAAGRLYGIGLETAIRLW